MIADDILCHVTKGKWFGHENVSRHTDAASTSYAEALCLLDVHLRVFLIPSLVTTVSSSPHVHHQLVLGYPRAAWYASVIYMHCRAAELKPRLCRSAA